MFFTVEFSEFSFHYKFRKYKPNSTDILNKKTTNKHFRRKK